MKLPMPEDNAQMNKSCPRCRMPRSEWPRPGVAVNGTTYCCHGCATGTGCTCLPAAKVKVVADHE